MTLFAKGADQSLALMAREAGYDVLGLDWCIEPSIARSIVDSTISSPSSKQKSIALQGNLDPNVLYAGRDAIEREVQRMCTEFKKTQNGGSQTRAWIANLGNGITPGVDPEDMKWFLECVHKYSKA